MKRKEQGITLVALIITIIIMLILVVVTVNISTGGGLFGKSKEAAFKTKVTQILDDVSLRKGEILADNPRATKFSIKMSELENVPDETKEEFDGKLKIKADANVYYMADAFDDLEKSWLEDLEIYEYIGIEPQIITLKQQIAQNPTQFYASASEYSEDVNDVAKILVNVLENNPNAFVYSSIATKSAITSEGNIDISDFIDEPAYIYAINPADASQINIDDGYQRMYKIWVIAANKNLSDDTVLTDDTDINALITEAKANHKWLFNDNITVGDYKAITGLLTNFLIINEDEIVYLSFDDIIDLSATKQLMKKEEFDEQFDYQLVNDKIYITKYKGTSKDVTIPAAVYDEYGNSNYVLGIQEGTFGTAYPNSMNDIMDDMFDGFTEDTTTLADAANAAYTFVNNLFGITVNPFTKYISDNIDGTSTSLEHKHKYVAYPFLKLYLNYANGRVITDQNVESLIASVSDEYLIPVTIEGIYDTYFFSDGEEAPISLVKPGTYNSITIYLSAEFNRDDENVLDPDGKRSVYRLTYEVSLHTKNLLIAINSFDYTDILNTLPAMETIFGEYNVRILTNQSNWRNLGESVHWAEPMIY